MCTAMTYEKNGLYFGRTLDYDFSYGDRIAITPRGYVFDFKNLRCPNANSRHLAMIGMAHMEGGYPLYYEALNEKGLAMAGLNFVGFTEYGTKTCGKYSLAPHEFIQFLLGRCEDLSAARCLLNEIRLEDRPFSEKFPAAQLHWIIADKSGCLTVESTKSGLNVYDNPIGILSNAPDFPQQMIELQRYMNLTARPPHNGFCSSLEFKPYSRGMGAIGLPGDWSSQSRFVRAAFTKLNSVCGDNGTEAVSQFFHAIGAVDCPRGACVLENGNYHMTRYTCCCDCERGIYYYTTCEDRQITAVDMRRENLDGCRVVTYEPITAEQIRYQN